MQQKATRLKLGAEDLMSTNLSEIWKDLPFQHNVGGMSCKTSFKSAIEKRAKIVGETDRYICKHILPKTNLRPCTNGLKFKRELKIPLLNGP